MISYQAKIPYDREVLKVDFEEVAEGIGENIKLARLRRKLITQQVANRAGISRKTLYAPTIGKPENIHKQTMNGASKQAQC